MIVATDLRFRWPGAARDCLVIDHLAVARGETLFLHGPSGCGKSTLLGLLAGVLVPTAGTLRLMGEPWSAWPAARRDRARADHLGYIFQQFNLLPYLSVLENVLLPCRFSAARAARAVRGHGSPEAAARALLQRVELAPEHWPRRADALSVGQQQRVAAARALIGEPALVIADEPTSALDAALRDGFMALLLGACAATASTLVFVSHDERLAGRFATRLGLPALNRAAA